MKRKVYSVMAVGALALISVTFTRCAIAKSKIESDADLQMDLVASEVKEKAPKKNATTAKEKSQETSARKGVEDVWKKGKCKSNFDCAFHYGGWNGKQVCNGICNANGICDRGWCPILGRPFTVEGKYRTTTSLIGDLSVSNGKGTWKMGKVPPTLANISINQVIAMEFSKQGEGEHSSVASFARHTLQLMTMGAPSKLLMSSQKASMDEIKHAKMCYGLASAFFGSNAQPGRLDIDGSVKSSPKDDIIQSVINEGCIGETIAAVRAQLGSHYAKQPLVKDALEQIAEDESNHAQLAWNTIQWAIERYPELRGITEETFRVQLTRPITSLNNIPMDHCDYCERDLALRDHGLLLDVDQDHTETIGIQNVIKPVVKHGFQNVDMISKQIINMDFMKY